MESSNYCMVNIYALARFKKLLLRNNWQLVNNCSNADLILVCTCAFNQSQEDFSLDIIRKMERKKKPDAELIVAGCLPKINKERLEEVFDGITISPRESDKIDDIIESKIKFSDIKDVIVRREDFQTSFLNSLNKLIANTFLRGLFGGIHKFFKVKIEPYYKVLNTIYDHHIFFIEACTGCLGNCSYCAIKHAKGTLKSAPIERIIEEFKYGLKKGYKKIALIGDDLGFYGYDRHTDLVNLLEEILKIKGDYQLLLYYIEPMDFEKMFPRLKNVFKSGRIIDVNIPVQTASNRITKLMNRNCDIEKVIKYASELKKEFPSCNVRTHVIVGFPGETEEDFEKSLNLFDAFDEVGIFEYTDRPNIPASRMPNKVPDDVRKARVRRMRRKFLYDLYFKKFINIRLVLDQRKNKKTQTRYK